MKELLKKMDIKPNRMEVYAQAFIHTSYAFEKNLPYSYERLEFLGDAIVDAIISDYLYRSARYEEGEMTKIRASYVCENALYEYANDLGFSNYIKVGRGEEQSGGRYKKAILADVFEAFIAAIYLDLGYEKAKEVTLRIVVPYIENENIKLFRDYKSALQEEVQTTPKKLSYELLEEIGPSHHRKFKVAVKIDDEVYGIGFAATKKEAEQEAAKLAILRWTKEN